MIFDSDSSILVLFCRKPSLGIGKRRIAAETGDQKALEISELLLAASAEDAMLWPDEVVVAPARPEDTDWAANLIPGGSVIPQCEGNLGERINHVDERIREAGGKKIIFIGSDAPGLSPALLEDAAKTLEDTDVCIMPANDGGVTLMGSRKPWPELSKLPWGTAELGSQLTAACVRADMSIGLLPANFDIDTCGDLLRELPELKSDTRATRADIAEWIQKNLVRTPALSIIIPVFNDLPALRQLLETLLAKQENEIEIIVSDGTDNDICRDHCDALGVHYLTSEACRGNQLRIGAEHSHGRVLWFLHADSEPAPDAMQKILGHIDQGHCGGYFSFRFSGARNWQKAVLEFAINLRSRWGIPYGDQGLFCTRDAYFKSGGFDKLPLFEEVKLVRNLRRLGKFSPLSTSIGVSPRRWEQDGWLVRSLHNRLLALAHMFGVPSKRLVARYKPLQRTD